MLDRDPYPLFEELRKAGPVIWDEGMRAWLVTGYDSCAHVERREDLFAAPWASRGFEAIFGRRGLFLLRGEAHRKLYAEIVRFFSPRMVQAYRRDVIAPLVNSRIDRFARVGTAELALDFAEQIPVRVIAALLGVAWQDEAFADQCWRWTDAFQHYLRTWMFPDAKEDAYQGAVDSMRHLDALLEPVVCNRAEQPPDS